MPSNPQINAQNVMGQTALMHATALSSDIILKKIISARPILNIQDKNGRTAMFYLRYPGLLPSIRYPSQKNKQIFIYPNLLTRDVEGNIACQHLLEIRALSAALAIIDMQSKIKILSTQFRNVNKYGNGIFHSAADVQIETIFKLTLLCFNTLKISLRGKRLLFTIIFSSV